MIEFCTRKRMAVAIVLLLSLTIVTLIVEGMWSTNHMLADVNADDKDGGQCGSADMKVLHECEACNTLELAAEQPFCTKTGYREEVQCKGGEPFKRSCRMDPWVAEKKFWILQLLTCLLGVSSYTLVKYRQSKLDQTLMEKVNRQIAA